MNTKYTQVPNNQPCQFIQVQQPQQMQPQQFQGVPQQIMMVPQQIPQQQNVQPLYNQQPTCIQQPIPISEQQKINTTNNNDLTTSVTLFVLGFFIYITWIINYCLFKKSTDKRVKTLSSISLVLFLIPLLSVIAFSIFYVVYWAIIIFFAYFY
ncbi:Transmembrane protein [Entamoeba marina]